MGNLLNSLFDSEENNRVSYESATVPSGTTRIYPRLVPEMVKTVQQERNIHGSQQQSWTQTSGGNQNFRFQVSKPSKQVRRATNQYTGLITMVLRCPETEDWIPADYTLQPVRLVQVSSTSCEYEIVQSLFKTTNQKCYKITRIDRIQNPYLMCAFLLKKEELRNRLGRAPDVLNVFHGTKRSSVPNICANNFDWRRNGEHVGVRFGKGVSFTPISNYATHYSDEENENKVMLLVKVLVGNLCSGEKGMTLPPTGYDTTGKENGHVIVKYEDNEFYPAYKITYNFTGNFDPKNKARRYKKLNINYI